MFPEVHIERFESHIRAMLSVLRWIVTTMETVPNILSCIKDEQQLRPVINVAVLKWADEVKALYQRSDLYVNSPNPLPIDQSCSGPALSDHIKERLGRNHPGFDFLNAPFTHPLGTQISLICINYVWDAYDTFLKQLLSALESRCESDGRLSVFREDPKHSTNEILKNLGLWPDDQEVIAAMEKQYLMEADLKPDHVLKAEHVGPVLRIAKELRNCFVHRFARQTPELEKLAPLLSFERFGVRILGDHFEVTLGPLPKHVAEVIQTYANLIHEKADELYGGLFPDLPGRS